MASRSNTKPPNKALKLDEALLSSRSAREPRSLAPVFGGRWRGRLKLVARSSAALILALLWFWHREVSACSLMMGPKSAVEIAHEASVIIRARAVDYAVRPYGDPPLGAVRFEVLEVIKGHFSDRSLRLPGQLEHYEGPNDGPVPYAGVRRGGRHGNCYAYDYKAGAEFLLFLQPETPYWRVTWAPLAATNEEASAEWVRWVREAVSDLVQLEAKAREVQAQRLEKFRKELQESMRRRTSGWS